MNRKLFIITIIILAALTGCQKKQVKEEEEKQYDRPLAPGQLALRRITDPSRIPDFTYAAYDTANLLEAVMHSLNYMSKPSSKNFFPYADVSHRRAVASLEAFGELLDSGIVGKELNDAIREKFDVYESVGCDDKGTVLFTGYYTPIFDGSLKPTEKFKYPLYSKPENLVKNEKGETLGQKNDNGTIVPYPSRQQIESSGMLKGKELLYLADPFEVYIAHVQGSAIIRQPDGKQITAGYAATNGHEYSSVAKKMITANAISGEKMSLSAMIDYFRQNPDKVADYVNQNPRFVFFLLTDTTPHGSINTPVTPYRTIATDKDVYPRACLAFISTILPVSTGGGMIEQRRYTGFALDQDTGGAIRAPGRCDVYMGIGDEAGKIAGNVYKEGRIYYLFLKPGLF